jgi:hypothetical protein
MRELELHPALALEGGAPTMPYRKRTAEYRSPPAPFAQQHDIPDGAFHVTLLSVGSGQLPIQAPRYNVNLPRPQFLILSALVLVEETELAGDLEDLALVLDHIVAPHHSRLGTAILSDRTA